MPMMSKIVRFEACEERADHDCIRIGIINDTIVEDIETFTVTVESLNDRIIPDPRAAVITIKDDDCEFTFLK